MKIGPRLFWFLNKRLYKKAVFLIIIALIPIVIFTASVLSKEKSGFVTVVLVQEDKDDRLAKNIIDELTKESGLVYYKTCDDAEEAEEMVRYGKADSAWIFPENIESMIEEYISGKEDYVVKIIEREQNVALKLTREKLSSVVYKSITKNVYLKYVRKELPQLDDLSDDKLIRYYEDYASSKDIFEFQTLGAEGAAAGNASGESEHYLTIPLRGLLSILIILFGMATAMLYLKDEQAGLFSVIPIGKRPFLEIIYQIISAVNIAVVVLASLIISGLAEGIVWELTVMALYIAASVLFCLLIRQLFRNIKIIAAVTPLLVVIMIAGCPIFFSLSKMRTVQMLFPPTYYINAMESNRWGAGMVVYILVLALMVVAGYFIEVKKGK